jgi:ABC-type nitrate/sulfonate/bicarbonate transport system permease component
MAEKNQTEDKALLLDVSVAEASVLYKFYLTHEGKILSTSAVLLFLIVWEMIGGVFQWVNPLFVSAPSLILKAAKVLLLSSSFWNDLWVSGSEFLWGFLLSAAVGVPMGIMTGWFRRMSYIFDPFVNALYATPRVAFLSLLIIWFGLGLMSKVALIFLSAVFPILINARDGVKTTPNNLLTAAKSFGASQWKIFTTVVIPSTVPFILTGLRLGVGRALIGVFVGELYAANAGIGYMITVAGGTFQTDKVFFGVLVFSLAGMLSMSLIGRLERHFYKWRPKVSAK